MVFRWRIRGRYLSRRQGHFLQAVLFILVPLWTWYGVWAIAGTVLLGVWSVMLGQNDFTVATLAVFAALTLLTAKAIFWVRAQDRHPREKQWAYGIFVVLAVLLFSVQYHWIQNKKYRVEALRVATRGSVVSQGPRETALMWTQFNGIHGLQMTPANLVVFVVITNRSKDPIWISRIEADYKSGWFGWKPLYALPGDHVYTGQTTSSMIRITMNAENTNQISAHPLQPENAYPAVALFQYPPDYKSPANLRIKVCDLDNDCSISRLSGQGESGVSATNGGEFTFNRPAVDLSHLYFSMWENR